MLPHYMTPHYLEVGLVRYPHLRYRMRNHSQALQFVIGRVSDSGLNQAFHHLRLVSVLEIGKRPEYSHHLFFMELL